MSPRRKVGFQPLVSPTSVKHYRRMGHPAVFYATLARMHPKFARRSSRLCAARGAFPSGVFLTGCRARCWSTGTRAFAGAFGHRRPWLRGGTEATQAVELHSAAWRPLGAVPLAHDLRAEGDYRGNSLTRSGCPATFSNTAATSAPSSQNPRAALPALRSPHR